MTKAPIRKFLRPHALFGVLSLFYASAYVLAQDLREQRSLNLVVLRLIYEDLSKQGATPELVSEFLAKSREFLRKQPGDKTIWLLRADAAVKGGNEFAGREAAQHLLKLGIESNSDPTEQLILAQLERKGWLVPMPDYPKETSVSILRKIAEAATVRFLVQDTSTIPNTIILQEVSQVATMKENSNSDFSLSVVTDTEFEMFYTDISMRPGRHTDTEEFTIDTRSWEQ